MRAVLCVCSLLLVWPAWSEERMTVSGCIRGRIDEKLVAGAEAATTAIFRSAGIELTWAACDIAPEGDNAVEQHWYTLRFRDGRPLIPPSLLAHDTLGEAFTSEDVPGWVAEVYYEAVENLAANKQCEPRTLMGYVIAHELAHLLLGNRHAPSGLMRAAWDLNDMFAIRQGSMKFSPSEGARMREALKTGISSAAAGR